MQKILVIGGGNMGFALLQSWTHKMPETRFHVVEPSSEQHKKLSGLPSVKVYAENADLPDDLEPNIIIFAVKPQVLPQVVSDYKHYKNVLFISIAAGIDIRSLEASLDKSARIVRTMPNTPSAIGAGMMVSVGNAHMRDEDKDHVDFLMSCAGVSRWVEKERHIDAVTAISGSGPAYLFHFIEALESASNQLGLEAELSRELALQTIFGAAKLARESEDTPAQLREQVTSPNGTTQAALAMLRHDDALEKIVHLAALAAFKRSKDLRRGK